jgi:hypothetical protein
MSLRRVVLLLMSSSQSYRGLPCAPPPVCLTTPGGMCHTEKQQNVISKICACLGVLHSATGGHVVLHVALETTRSYMWDKSAPGRSTTPGCVILSHM